MPASSSSALILCRGRREPEPVRRERRAAAGLGEAFDSSQVTLNLIAVGYSLGLPARALYLGALGDRYAQAVVVLGTRLGAVSLLAAYARRTTCCSPRASSWVSRRTVVPATLALMTALWTARHAPSPSPSGPARRRARRSRPVVAGALLQYFWWGSVFLMTLPLAGVALVMAFLFVPSHVNETPDPVDNLGGIFSVLLVRGAHPRHQLRAGPEQGTLVLGLAAIALAARRLLHPPAPGRESPLRPQRRRTPDVLGRGVRGDHRVRLADGQRCSAAAVPPERERVFDARGGGGHLPGGPGHRRRRASLAELVGARRTVHAALRLRVPVSRSPASSSSGTKGVAYWQIAVAYAFTGAGVGLEGTPASHSLTGSVPVTRAGMASGTADLQRDLGGAIMQSIFGVLLPPGMRRPYRRRSRCRARTSRRARRRAHEVVRQRRGGREATPPVRGRDHRRGRSRRSSTATTGPTRPARWRSSSVRCSSSSCSRSTRRRSSSSLRTTHRTPESPSGDLERRVPAAATCARACGWFPSSEAFRLGARAPLPGPTGDRRAVGARGRRLSGARSTTGRHPPRGRPHAEEARPIMLSSSPPRWERSSRGGICASRCRRSSSRSSSGSSSGRRGLTSLM